MCGLQSARVFRFQGWCVLFKKDPDPPEALHVLL